MPPAAPVVPPVPPSRLLLFDSPQPTTMQPPTTNQIDNLRIDPL